MTKHFITVSIVLGLLAVGLQNAAAQSSAQRVTSSLSDPLYGTHIPGDTNRMFWLQQGSGGTGQIISQNLTTGATSNFMSISGLFTGGERGLLGLAFDPNYATNGQFYTYVSANSFGAHQSQVRRYTVSGDPATSNVGDPNSSELIMSFSQPFSNHNGGWIGFNPKVDPSDPQYLYIGSGDGGSGGDPGDRSQDITNQLLGKILRIDVNGDDFPADPGKNYAIPASNPFVGTTGDDEIWAYGIRNPWRNSFDRKTGDFWIGDVGQNVREEINFQPANSPGGENYGWRVMEGTRCFNNNSVGPPCFDDSLVDPIHEYNHNSAGGFSVTGGYTYHGSASEFSGLYFFADFATNNIWTLDPYAEDPSASVLLRNNQLVTNAGSISGVSSFAEDANGEVYIVSYNGNTYRIESSSTDAVWDGNAAVGTAGNGMSWNDANNWTRGGTTDQVMVASDRVVFAPGSSSMSVDLQGNRTAGAVLFQAGYDLTGGTLTVRSGDISVDAGVVASINGGVAAETSNASIRKRGAGQLDLNGTAGQVVVLEGTLGGIGTIDSIRAYAGSRVAPGLVVGELTTSSYTQQAGATLEIQIGLTSDKLTVNGTASIDGDLEIDSSLYTPTARGTVDDFVLVTATALIGSFDEVTFDGIAITPSGNEHVGDGLFVNYSTTSTEVLLSNYYALPGDANGDGTVNGEDFLIWNANKFTSGTDWTTGDFNGDGDTNGADFLLWNQFKFTSADLAAVPEPTGLLVLLAGLAGLAIRRRV
jgi:glucose/arabinose dehydrogenase